MDAARKKRLTLLPVVDDNLDSPFRRRSMPAPNTTVNNGNQMLNDDDAERRTSRRFDMSASENESSMNLAEEADSLNTCLKLFAENKINKDNAWSINIIDSFAKLISRHHQCLSNYQVAGTTLEASAKVYGLRVDSVYTDVCRMSAGLPRQSAKALTKRGNRNAEDDENPEHDENDPNATNQDGQQQPKAKKPKKKRIISTVTKNPESLNGKLDTIPLTDPFFAKLNSVIGDTTSSNRLLQNIIPTEDSKLKLRQNMPIWDSKDQPELNLNQKIDYKQEDPTRKMLSFKPNYRIGNISPLGLRTGLSNYRITNEPIKRYEDNDTSYQSRFADDLENSVMHNSMQAELQFDINAAVEPVPVDRSIVMDFGDMDQGDFEDVNEMDLVAMEHCKGLRRQAVVIEDMQPGTCATLEYSYQPLDMINQFWAGPPHWKFKQSRLTATRGSQLTAASTSDRVTQKFNNRKRKLISMVEAKLDDARNAGEDRLSMFIEIKPNIKGTQLSNQMKKWEAKQHKLPCDHKVPAEIFNKLVHASYSLHINSNPDDTFTNGDDDAAPYDYDNENDRNYCSRVAEQSDSETETNTEIGQMDNNFGFDNVEMPPPPALIDEISDVFVGAPELIEKMSIAFAKRAKQVDMKQLKSCSWDLLNNKHSLNPLRNPQFSEVLRDLPLVLSRTMAENMSMPLAFYAVLHLCNDKRLLLHQINDSRKKVFDFEVAFVKDQLNTSASQDTSN